MNEHSNRGRRPSFIAVAAMLTVGLWGLVAPVTAAAQSIWELNATDSVGGTLQGVIEVDANGFVTAADVFNLHTINALGADPGDVRYTLVNSPGLPNNGFGFGLTSSWANGQSGYYSDNLWFVLNGNLTQAVPVGTVLSVVPNGGYLGDPAGSLRMDAYGDPIGLTGTLTRIIRGRPGPAGPTGPTGAVGASGADGAPGPTGAVGAMGPVGANGAQGAVGATGPAGPAGAISVWEFNATDSVGGAVQGVIEVDEHGVVTAADVFNLHTINAFNADSGDVRYTLINAGLPNNGSGFGLTSIWANGHTPYYSDNLWFALSGNLSQAGAVGTVVNVVSNGGYLGDPAGSLRMDAYGDPIGLAGTLTRIIRGRAGPTGPAGAVGATGGIGATGPMGPVGPLGPAGPMGPAGAVGAQGASGATGATGPAGPAGAISVWEFNATDSVGGAVQGVIEVDEHGVVTAADVFNLHTINAFNADSGDVRYTLINAGLPNNGSGFGLTSIWANGHTPYYSDNLWFALSGNLSQAGAVGTVVNVVSNGGYLGDPAGSLRMDAYGDPIGLTGTLTRIIRGRAGETGPAGSNGSNGSAGPMGPAGAQGPAGPTGATGQIGPMGPAGPSGAQGAAGTTGATGPAGTDGAQGPAGPVGATGPAGANGAQGPAGPTGATGATGAPGASDLPSGTVIFLIAGTPAPAGWTLIGTGMDVVKPGAGIIPGPHVIRLDVYRKN